MPKGNRFSDTVISHLTDIGAGRCTITEADIIALHESAPDSAEILMGLSHLHEDLVFFRQEQQLALQREEEKNKKLAEAIVQAEEANRAKSRFLANRSHEIRTPMNGIMGVLSVLESSKLSPQQSDLLKVLRASSSNLLSIVNDILDFSKIESGQFELDIGDIELEQCIKDTISLYSHSAYEKNIGLHYKISNDSPSVVRGDTTRFRQIVENLLSNAIKFTLAGKVELSLETEFITKTTANIIIKVKDTGIGIDSKHQDSLFDSFTQADSSITREFGGSGLGLSICAGLLQIMNGSIRVNSSLGHGSTFTVCLPMEIVKRDEKPKNSVIANNSLAERYPHEILVVEDNEINQVVAMANLESLGYQCDAANNGQEALDMIRKSTR
ncbi:MAG: ATP-binding protein [Glaciecola sp.]